MFIDKVWCSEILRNYNKKQKRKTRNFQGGSKRKSFVQGSIFHAFIYIEQQSKVDSLYNTTVPLICWIAQMELYRRRTSFKAIIIVYIIKYHDICNIIRRHLSGFALFHPPIYLAFFFFCISTSSISFRLLGRHITVALSKKCTNTSAASAIFFPNTHFLLSKCSSQLMNYVHRI